MSSREVSWWTVHEYVAPLLNHVRSWPMVGTPAWFDLDDHEPRKLAAIFDASRHWALRVEMCQQALADAGEQISAGAPWSRIAEYQRNERQYYEARPWMRRKGGQLDG